MVLGSSSEGDVFGWLRRGNSVHGLANMALVVWMTKVWAGSQDKASSTQSQQDLTVEKNHIKSQQNALSPSQT